MKGTLKRMSDRSFVIYLIHPLFIDQLEYAVTKWGGGLGHFPLELFYLLILGISWGIAEAWHQWKKP